jgi:uncharacterized protein YecE (DUF72 family)
MSGVEINSSFYRPHRRSTWMRWGESVPAGFRFAAKIPKEISHTRRLVDVAEPLERFLGEVEGLGDKLAILLVQLPPSLAFEQDVAAHFLADLTARTTARVVCEPRHASWFEPAADALLAGLEVARVAADPARVPAAALPGGWRGISYRRLHGSPVMYRSAYGADRLRAIAAAIQAEVAAGVQSWCMFDNTASSAALGDARLLADLLATE